MTERKTVVFGLDGAHFELLEPWIRDGHLPNVARAMETGVVGDLQSVLPPVTSPNWKAYATGKNPGKLGIFWWENVDTDAGRVYYPTERKHAHDEFWELIAEREPVGVLGVPTTYPPNPVDGFVVAGAPDGHDTGYAHPASLEDRLEREYGYRVTKRHRLADDVEAASDEIVDLVDARFTVARDLSEAFDVSFLQATTFYLNSLHHFRWDDENTRRAWTVVDEHVGRFLDEGHDVVLMSDHGSNEVETVFRINTWLEREGYLALQTGPADLLHSVGINTDRVARIASTLGVKGAVQRLAPDWLRSYVPDESGALRREGKTGSVDWDRTEVIASGQGPVYLTRGRDDPGYEELRAEVRSKLASLRDPRGNPVARGVYPGEAVYDGPYLSEAPDLVVDQAPNVHVPGGIGRDSVFDSPDRNGWIAENKRSGLFVATGPSFATGAVDDLSILDLAPTFLHLHDRPVPEDMDGRVRTSLFAPDASPRERDVRYRAADEREREREARRIRRVARRHDL